MEEVKLGKVLKEEFVVLDCPPFKNKDDAFTYVADMFYQAGTITDRAEYIKSLEYRESLGSTYMGNFIGLPHGKSDAVKESSIAFCRCIEPFDYVSGGETGQVKYVFALAIEGQKSAEEYLRILATLAGNLAKDEFIALLEQAKSYEEIIAGLN